MKPIGDFGAVYGTKEERERVPSEPVPEIWELWNREQEAHEAGERSRLSDPDHIKWARACQREREFHNLSPMSRMRIWTAGQELEFINRKRLARLRQELKYLPTMPRSAPLSRKA